jgi:hypothetical protein
MTFYPPSRNDVNAVSKSNKQKAEKNSFLVAVLRSLTKIPGSGAGSVSQNYGSGSVRKCHGSATLIGRTTLLLSEYVSNPNKKNYSENAKKRIMYRYKTFTWKNRKFIVVVHTSKILAQVGQNSNMT